MSKSKTTSMVALTVIIVFVVILGYLVAGPYQLATRIMDKDSDGDSLLDSEENKLGLNTFASDTDGDGIADRTELELKSDPKNSDTDSDGLTDGFEYYNFHSDPLRVDSDDDKLSDKEEFSHQTNPNSGDTDLDGASDYNEIYIRKTNPLFAEVSFFLHLTDKETNKVISGAAVSLDNKNMGSLTQEGVIRMELVPVGQHQISITYKNYGIMDIGYTNVETSTRDVWLSVDMPNPIFVVSPPKADQWLNGLLSFNQVGTVTVTVTNRGNIDSFNTMALVTVYDSDNFNLISSDVVHLGAIPKGQVRTVTTSVIDFNYWTGEYVSVVIMDGSEYLPKANLQASSVDSSGFGVVARDSANYLVQHPEVALQIATAVVGFI